MRCRALLAISFGLLGACATAEKDKLVTLQGDGGTFHPPGDDGGGDGSGSGRPPPDAFILPDAPPNMQQVTLDQNSSDSLVAGNSAICPDADNDNGSGESHYYRIFDLAAAGITSDFTISGVTFQVEDAYGVSGDVGDGDQAVDINVGTYSGALGGSTFKTANLSQISSVTDVDVPEVDEDRDTTPATTPGATVTAPLAATIPGGSKLYVEIASSDGTQDHWLYLGTNKSSETEPGYLYAPNCVNDPTSMSSLTQTLSPARNAALLITVTGTY
jgi:hypothetical protein